MYSPSGSTCTMPESNTLFAYDQGNDAIEILESSQNWLPLWLFKDNVGIIGIVQAQTAQEARALATDTWLYHKSSASIERLDKKTSQLRGVTLLKLVL